MKHTIGSTTDSWPQRSHSANPVPVFAIGKGSGQFGGMMNNVVIPAKIMNATK